MNICIMAAETHFERPWNERQSQHPSTLELGSLAGLRKEGGVCTLHERQAGSMLRVAERTVVGQRTKFICPGSKTARV